MLELNNPNIMYKESYLAALQEYHREGRNLRYDYNALSEDFAGFVQMLLDKVEPTKLQPDCVEESIFWLMDAGDYIGRVSVRHRLDEDLFNFNGHIGYDIRPSRRKQGYGKKALQLALLKAREFGLPRILITCNWDNEGSRKIIESGGGIFEDGRIEIREDGMPNEILRYWIELG